MLLQRAYDGPRYPQPPLPAQTAAPAPTRMFCPCCGFDRPDDAKSCPECHQRLIDKAEVFEAARPRKGLDPCSREPRCVLDR
jgi:hypothetical protein